MKYLSLFSGIGGFELGIQQAYENLANKYERSSVHKEHSGNTTSRSQQELPTCIGYSEIDKYAIKVYQHHFPTHTNYGDITKIKAEDLPEFDLIVGGFPCQSFSIAGKRGGFNDTRGTLFFDIARIIKAKQPHLLFLENVKGLLSHDEGRTFATIISTLDELGYDVQWQVLNSKNHGVPQNRERVFIIGHLRGTPRPQVFPFGSNDEQVTDIQGQSTNTLTARYEGAQATGSYIIESEQHAQEIKQLNNPTHSNDRVYGADGISPTLNTMQGGMRQPFIKIPEATTRGYAEAGIGDSINLSVPNSTTRRGRVGHGIAQTLDTGMQQFTLTDTGIRIDEETGEVYTSAIRRLTPQECERLQGFPDNWTAVENTSDSQRYKMCGNAVTVNVIRDIMERIIPTPPLPTTL